FDDMARLTEYRADPDLVEVLVTGSQPAMHWLRSKGVRFVPSYGRQAYDVDGEFHFWGGAVLEASGGGAGLVEQEEAACRAAGVEILYGARARELVVRNGRVCGVRFEHNRQLEQVDCDAVVLASGGFQANAAWRTRYLGPGWDLAKVRG